MLVSVVLASDRSQSRMQECLPLVETRVRGGEMMSFGAAMAGHDAIHDTLQEPQLDMMN
jgi:hypothetical protein